MGTEQFYVPEIHRLDIPLLYLVRHVRWDPTIFPRLLKILRQCRPHIIDTNSEMAMFYAWPLARLLGIKVVNFTIQNAFSGQGCRWQFHKAMLKLADARVSNSAAGFATRGINPKSPANYVIYNGLDRRRFDPSDKRTGNLGFDPKGRKVVGMLAEFSDYKDYPTFIRAAQQVLAKRDDVVFVAVGGGKNLKACQGMASSEPFIHFLGERRDVEPLIQQMDIGVLCTFTEGISNSLMEFMAAGKPVIVTDGGGSRELVTDGQHGFLVPSSNPDGVAKRIELLLDDGARCERMGVAGQRRIADSFSLEELGARTLAMYRQVVGSKIRNDCD
jgi:glycosyltransferase involved in cell wall biosynthesis